MSVVLEPESHVYRNTETGEQYTSVTTFIGQFKQAFDKDKWSKHVAARDGVDQSMVLDAWKQLTLQAQIKGTQAHNVLEQYLKTGQRTEQDDDIINSFNERIKPLIKGNTSILSETLVYDHKHKLAGTADVFVVDGARFHVLDFKTNKKFNYYSKYNEYFKQPLDHLQQCEFTTYTLQMSIYAYLYEMMTNRKCASIRILYLQNTSSNRYWQDVHCIYMKDAVINMLNHRFKELNS